jgi:hypothetical protein
MTVSAKDKKIKELQKKKLAIEARRAKDARTLKSLRAKLLAEERILKAKAKRNAGPKASGTAIYVEIVQTSRK